MQKRLLNEAEAYAKRNHRRQVWRKLVRMMACVVVFCTTYALILPAITMERSQCELEEHIHSESCYAKVTTRQQQTLSCTYDSLSVHQHTPECRDGEGALICGYGDYLVHEHDAACTDEAGILVCQLPVVKAHTHTEEDCFAPVEMETEHIHDDTCYTLQRGELLCQIEETPGHAHGDECYTLGELQCQLEEREGHTHTETCTEKILLCDLTVEPHVHTDACYRQLTCDLSTEPAHTHTDACTGRTLTCTSEEEGHEHTDACYLQLTCDLSTEPLHTHTDACTGRVLDCQQTEQPHIHTDECYQVNDLCGQEEQEGHTHTRACYASELTCEAEETEGHTHTDSCYEQKKVLTCELPEADPAEESAEPELELICEKPEVVLHTHTDACYETYLDEAGAEQRRLICPELEVRTHTHGESCYITQEIPMEDVDTLTCQVEEAHRHTEQCYDETGALACQHPEDHTHGERCYGTWELICGKEEHTHTAECSALLGLPEEDRLAVEEVIALIEPLPTYDDMMAKLDEFYEADDMEGEEAYMMEVYAQVEEAYRAYMALPEELREYVSNADKLMELEFIWSRITLEATPTIVTTGTWPGNLNGTHITNEIVYQFVDNAVVTLDGTIVIGNGGKVTILGSGSIVRGANNNDQPLIVVLEGGELVIGDTSPENTNTRKDYFVVDGADVVVDVSTTTDIISGANSNGWGSAIYSMGKVTLVNTTVQNNKNRKSAPVNGQERVYSLGGGLFITSTGSLNLDRCAIKGNTAGAFGGGFYSNGPVNAKNTEIADNRAMTTEYGLNESKSGIIGLGRGGGFALSGANAIGTFDNVNIHDNACMYYGGGGQVDSKAVLTMNSGSFRNNIAVLHGAGGLHLTSDATFIMNGGSITGNTCYYVGGGIHTSYGTTLRLNGGEISNNVAYGRGGGIHIDCGSELILDGTNIIGNRALTIAQRPTSAVVDATGDNWSNIGYVGGNMTQGIGGGVLVDCGTCAMSAGTVSGNHADYAGGGLGLVMIIVGEGSRISYNEVASINLTGGIISNNTTNGNGAGLYLMRNAFGELSQEDLKLTTDEQKTIYNQLRQEIPSFIASGGTMRNNVAQNDGGGAYQETGTEFTITGTALFEENEAVRNGGAVYIDQGTAEISGGTMTNNQAGESGGALFINGTVTMSNGDVTNNSAKNAGGIFVAGGDVVMTNGKVTGNTATENGGAVYVANTSVTFGAEGGAIEVTNNTAKNGAGFYIDQSGGTHTTTISNGQITGNTATGNGGGIYQTGASAVCTISGGGSVSNNTAANGGGFYIDNGTMNVNGGYVVSNSAVGTSANTTAYSSAANTGVGGGIYLNKGSYIMTAETDVGLYGNLAGFAADDVYASPDNTTLSIPAVKAMNLTNFGQTVGKVTDWFEDYASQDSRYENGLKGENYPNSSPSIKRYRQATNEQKVPNKIINTTNKYVCLTLGYEMDYTPIVVKKVVTSYDNAFTTDQEFRFKVEHNDGVLGVIETELVLKHGEEKTVNDVLRNSSFTVTEINPEGYVVSAKVLDKNGNEKKSALNSTITATSEDGLVVVITNYAGYELPNTGGTGTYLYTTGGLLIMAAAILLYIHNQRRRKEETPSF